MRSPPAVPRPARLRAYQPRWSETIALPAGNDTLHLPDIPQAAKVAAAWRATLDAKPAGRPAAVAAALAGAGQGTGPAAGLVAMDRYNQGVACALTLGAPFGTGRIIPGTGI